MSNINRNPSAPTGPKPAPPPNPPPVRSKVEDALQNLKHLKTKPVPAEIAALADMEGRIRNFTLPMQLGQLNLLAREVMYYLYLPVSQPGSHEIMLPDERLKFVLPLLRTVRDNEPDRFTDEWVYLTIKKMYVGGGNTPNRPGWHCDGFLSDDLNYIWADCIPTVFTSGKFSISPDHIESLKQFDEQAEAQPECNVMYQDCTLLKLTPSVIHRVNTEEVPQTMRTFVKVTLSRNRFNLMDNSINPLIPDDIPKYARSLIRNDPTQAQGDVYLPTPKDDHLV